MKPPPSISVYRGGGISGRRIKGGNAVIEVYWGCLIGGIVFAVVSVFFGDIVSDFLDGTLDFLSADIFEPMVIVGGITGLGGAGILLSEYTSFGGATVFAFSVLIAVFLSICVYFGYVRPMKNSENSTAYSMQDLAGKIGEVSVPIPANGYGEVLVKVGAGNTNQIAASFDKEDIRAGTRVVVVEVQDGTLYVSRFDE
jgi:membrane protein implicated in regulation of membrane protease activity